MKKKVAVVAGGYSSEFGVSLKSAEGLLSFIDPERYEVYLVVITKEKWMVQWDEQTEIPIDKNDFSFTHSGVNVHFDFAYITIHGTPGENGLLQGYFDMLGIPYSSCGVLASAIAFDKHFCNHYLWGTMKARFAEFVSIHKKEGNHRGDGPFTIDERMKLPVIVKPNDGGSSFGITKVYAFDKLQPAIDNALKEGAEEVLVQRFIPGREVTCGCYKIKDKLTVLPITEVISKNDVFDFDAKYNPGRAEEITPARLSPLLTEQIQRLTSDIYLYVKAKGIIRVDYIISPENVVYLLEVNTTPGMTATSFIPQQVKAAGLNMRDVLTEIIENELNER